MTINYTSVGRLILGYIFNGVTSFIAVGASIFVAATLSIAMLIPAPETKDFSNFSFDNCEVIEYYSDSEGTYKIRCPVTNE